MSAEGETGGARKRAPVYSVFQLRTLEESGVQMTSVDGAYDAYQPGAKVEAWVLIAENVAAPNDRAAIVAATQDLPEGEGYGTFWAPIAGTLKPRTRRKKITHEDVWEDAP